MTLRSWIGPGAGGRPSTARTGNEQILPDGKYEAKSIAVDEQRNNVCAFGIFRGTHTGEGGPVPPTHQKVEADYVYVMDFDGDRIRHLTKVWNDTCTLRQAGWA